MAPVQGRRRLMEPAQIADDERYLCIVCQEERPPGLMVRGDPAHFCPTVEDEQSDGFQRGGNVPSGQLMVIDNDELRPARNDGCDHHFELTEDGYRCVHCDALRVPHNDGQADA